MTCGVYRGWYAWNGQGRVQITWTGTPDDGPSLGAQHAAVAACEKADNGQRTSKAGRIDAGG